MTPYRRARSEGERSRRTRAALPVAIVLGVVVVAIPALIAVTTGSVPGWMVVAVPVVVVAIAVAFEYWVGRRGRV